MTSDEGIQTWLPEKSRITMSHTAVLHLQRQIAKRGSGVGMRLGIKKSGCSGYGYKLDIIDSPEAEDKIYQVNDELIVVVSSEHLPYLQGTSIDYVKKGLNASFKFTNLNEVNSCGCGESFSISETDIKL